MVSRNPTACQAITAAGSPCSAQPVLPSGWCYWHDPALAVEREAARRRGGAHKSNQARARRRLPDGILSVDEVRGLLGKALKDVLTGQLDAGPANAAAAIARSLLAANEAAAVERLEVRLAELERLAARAQLA